MVITVTAAVVAFVRLNPLWMLPAGGVWVSLALSSENR
jgi:hypothetical protein